MTKKYKKKQDIKNSHRRRRAAGGGIKALMENDFHLSKENLANIDKPRKSPPTSFIAQYGGTECTRCHLTIEKGERVRYDDEGLHHISHKTKEVKYEICPTCFLTLPCDCEK